MTFPRINYSPRPFPGGIKRLIHIRQEEWGGVRNIAVRAIHVPGGVHLSNITASSPQPRHCRKSWIAMYAVMQLHYMGRVNLHSVPFVMQGLN